jgi:hypothetical protein
MKQKREQKNKFLSVVKNKYFWIILIPDLFIFWFIIKYSSVLFIALLLKDPNLQTAGLIIALFVFKAIVDLIISVKLLKKEI